MFDTSYMILGNLCIVSEINIEFKCFMELHQTEIIYSYAKKIMLEKDKLMLMQPDTIISNDEVFKHFRTCSHLIHFHIRHNALLPLSHKLRIVRVRYRGVMLALSFD